MSESEQTLEEKMIDPNSVLYFVKVFSCLGNLGKKLKYEENIISSIEKDVICHGEGIPLKGLPVNVTIYVSFIGTMITCLKYEMKDEFHNVVQTGTNSSSFSDIDVKNLTAGIEHFAKCSRKRNKRV